MFKNITYYLIAFSILFLSCDKMPEKYPCDNIKDPDCEGYISPNARLVSSPSQGEIIDTNAITISWNGRLVNSLYSYRISDTSSWTPWSGTKSITYNCMNDDDYRFYVKECYPSGDEQVNATTVYFTIDYISGTSIVLENQCIEATINNEFEVFVSLEEVDSVLGAFVSISFDQDIINLTERQALSSIIGTSLSDLVFIATEVSTANNNGLIELNLARFSSEPSTSDAKQIIKLKFRAISTGATQIIINPNSQLRDIYNTVIEINRLINANLNIQ